MNIIQKSVQLKQELDSLRPLKKEEELRIMQKLRLDWNYHSNHLEGNKLTYGETKALILFGITADGKPLRDHIEITGHNEAIKWVMEIVEQERPLTQQFIKELHQLILKERYQVNAITPDGQPTKRWIEVGNYKSSPNHVRTATGEIFRFATPEETPAKMHDLIDWYRSKMEDEQINPILLAAEFHYKYIRIHPFDDGNGRTARILMNFILMQFNYPPVIIKTEDKANYFAALRQADAGILTTFIEYIAQNLNHSLEIMIKGAKGESIEEPDDLDKEIALLEQQLKELSHGKALKRKNSIYEIYENSIIKLSKKFIAKNKLFNKFYKKYEFHLDINYKEENIYKSKKFIKPSIPLHKYDEITSIHVHYSHSRFTHDFIKSFNQVSIISFSFEREKYIIIISAGSTLEKQYDEQLSKDEIMELVGAEIRRHKQVIEQKIKALKQ